MISLLILMFVLIVCCILYCIFVDKIDKQLYYYKETYKGRKMVTRYGLSRMREIVNSKRSKF